MKKQDLINCLRWLAVLPAAIVAPIIISCVLIILLLIGDALSGNLWIYLRNPDMMLFDHFFTSFIISGVVGYVFIAAGAFAAPKFKIGVAFTLFGIISILLGFVLIASLIMLNFGDSWRFIINVIILLSTAGFAAFATGEDDVVDIIN